MRDERLNQCQIRAAQPAMNRVLVDIFAAIRTIHDGIMVTAADGAAAQISCAALIS
jgi:hypothetical protein